MSPYTPPSMREEALADAEQAAHDARCAQMADAITASADEAVAIICEAHGLVCNDDAKTYSDWPVYMAVAAVYVEARNNWPAATPAAQQLVRVLETSLARVVDARIAEEDREEHRRGLELIRRYDERQAAQRSAA